MNESNRTSGSGTAGSQETAKATYPFTPKSTTALQPGQFWPILLPSERYGCGRVLSLKTDAAGQVDRRLFLAGLMDWIGDEPPTAAALAGVRVIEPGICHVKAILETGGAITGWRALELDGNEPVLFLSAAYGGDVSRGLVYLRPATDADAETIPVLSTYGYLVLRDLAEELDRTRTR